VERTGRNRVQDGGDRPPITKAVTGFRTPENCLLLTGSVDAKTLASFVAKELNAKTLA
jgi:hypothetical protein